MDEEQRKINKEDIRRLERVLDTIDKYEKKLIESFDKDIEKILGNTLLPVLIEAQKLPNMDSIKTRKVRINGTVYKLPYNFLRTFHKSYIEDPKLREEFGEKVSAWFKDKTATIKSKINDVNNYDDVEKALPPAFALASLALTSFHNRPNMILHDVQKLAGIAISEGSIAELGTGEGKTLAGVLPVYLQALRGKGAHVITSNGYLARRDFEETLPIFEGLGLTSAYLPDNESELAVIEGKDPDRLTIEERRTLQKKIKIIKKEAYKKDITYGAKQSFAFDYLRDSSITKREDMVQREERPGFALIDEVDDALIDDAQIPYRIASTTPVYTPHMTLRELCELQEISYADVLNKVKDLGISDGELTYEEARYISKTFGKKELSPDPLKYQKLAQRFFERQNVLVTEDNMFGFKTGKECYRALLDEENYDSEEVKRKYGIIYCRELREYKISDTCIESFLRTCYLSYHINSLVLENQQKILNDRNYVNGKDYVVLTSGNRVKMTVEGANKILNDPNYPDFVDDFNQFMSTVSLEATAMLHYLNQAVIANLMMKNGENYTIQNGKVKTLKNGRIMEGSKYTNGLHQAIEIKEGIEEENMTKDSASLASITQKDFYSRYDMFSGMTGTSSKEVFGEIYGKSTVEIPKHAYYSYYSKRKIKGANEPIGVSHRDTRFTLNLEDKINLIVNSVISSHTTNPQQPVLIVVADVNEIPLLQKALLAKGINPSILTSQTPKEDEALIISRAGLPGRVTISTEMAGRGTDIKMGGDRETIIDIALQRQIRKMEKQKKSPRSLTVSEKEYLRRRVEDALVKAKHVWTKEEEQQTRDRLSKTGLKVVSSGFFKMTRIDRQLEGRTGRNGISGTCERYAYPEDLKRIGISSFNMKDSITSYFQRFKMTIDRAVAIDETTHSMLMERIREMQKNNEANIKEGIKNSQKLDGHATKLVEKYRDQRRKILCDSIEAGPLVEQMITEATDAIISSFIVNKEIKEEDLKVPLNKSSLNIDVDAISLEVKQILGITFDPSVVTKSNINLMELRDAIIRTAKERHKGVEPGEDKKALLVQNDFMIANVPEILEHSFTVKRLTSLSFGGSESDVDYAGDMAFSEAREALSLEACKQGMKSIMGLSLTVDEFKKLESRKRRLYSGEVKKSKTDSESYEVKEANFVENNVSAIDRFRAIKKRLDKQTEKEKERVRKNLEEEKSRGLDIDLTKAFSGLTIRPVKIVDMIVNNAHQTKLILVRDELLGISEKKEAHK